MSILKKIIPKNLQATLYLRYFGFTKIPLIFFLKPTIIELTNSICRVRIPLNRRSKNHLNSMYFAALAAGADVAGGLIAMKRIEESGHDIALSFKEFKAYFIKRAEGDTFFTCTQGEEITSFVNKVINSNKRQNMKLYVTATCPNEQGESPVATFELILSLKKGE